MPKIYKYQKITDQYTTYLLAEPDYNLLGEEFEDRITELCVIDGITYVSVPDTITLPVQLEIISNTLEEVVLTAELLDQIKNTSCHVALINDRIVSIPRSTEWGDAELARLGLVL
jgi:hypothetical protein